MEETTSNSFAICLVYYYNYCRNKLVREDLLKIRRKYERKASQLLIDLKKKYVFDMPEKVNVQSVLRVVGSFDIPDEYIAVAGLSEYVSSQSPKYDQRVDITSQDFDVDLAFQCGTIFCSFKTCPMEDNMSKARKYVAPLLPDDERGESEIQSKEAQGLSKSASRRVAALAAKEKEKEERRPFFERLADASIPKYVMRNEMGVETTLPSPLALLYDFMQRKERVRIVVRRRHAIRGSMDAYIRGFDRYWNLYLSDVDEEFIFNKVRYCLFILQHRFTSVKI